MATGKRNLNLRRNHDSDRSSDESEEDQQPKRRTMLDDVLDQVKTQMVKMQDKAKPPKPNPSKIKSPKKKKRKKKQEETEVLPTSNQRTQSGRLSRPPKPISPFTTRRHSQRDESETLNQTFRTYFTRNSKKRQH